MSPLDEQYSIDNIHKGIDNAKMIATSLCFDFFVSCVNTINGVIDRIENNIITYSNTLSGIFSYFSKCDKKPDR